MPKVNWTPENDRRLLIHLITCSAKSYDTDWLSKLFPGATPKAIEERIAKLKREAKASAESDPNAPSRQRCDMEADPYAPRKRYRGRSGEASDPDATEDEERGVKRERGGGRRGRVRGGRVRGGVKVEKAVREREGAGLGKDECGAGDEAKVATEEGAAGDRASENGETRAVEEGGEVCADPRLENGGQSPEMWT